VFVQQVEKNCWALYTKNDERASSIHLAFLLYYSRTHYRPVTKAQAQQTLFCPQRTGERHSLSLAASRLFYDHRISCNLEVYQ
jgi:hypothetical protein